MKKITKIQLLFISLIIGLGCQQVFSYMAALIDEIHYQNQRIAVDSQLSKFRVQIENQINSTFYIAKGLALYLNANFNKNEPAPILNNTQIDFWAKSTVESLPYIKNIGLAQGYIINYVYPLKGNEKILGYDYRKIHSQWPAVKKAIENKSAIVAGPLKLIQGGLGLICRIPLYHKAKDKKLTYVGIVSMVLDYPKLLNTSGYEQAAKNLNIAIRNQKTKNKDNSIFHGNRETFVQQGIIQQVSFLGGKWELAAIPKNGWSFQSQQSKLFSILGWCLSITITLLIYFAFRGLQEKFQRNENFANLLEKKVELRTIELNEAKEFAEQANQTKSKFLAIMTHELRTPLNSIIGLTQIVNSMPLGKEQKHYLSKVSTSASILLKLINNVLSYSQMESDKLTITKNPFNLYDIINKLDDLFTFSANDKNIQFSSEISPQVNRYLSGDEGKLIQILTNLCGNAIKFTSKGSVSLSITLTHEKGNTNNQNDNHRQRIKFSICDTGIGIEKGFKDKLFKPFKQLNSGLSRHYEGSGLGLSICKNMIELMGGKIELDSQPNKGSNFWFELDFPIVKKEMLDTQQKNETIEQLIQRVKPLLSGVCIILAEDNPVNQSLMKAVLGKIEVEVIIANNGEEVLQQLSKQSAKKKQVNGILMDLQMPKMDGLETTRQIRKTEQFKQIPIIAMTANAMQEDKEQALAAGMNSFISKPVNFSLLYTDMIKWFTESNS